MTKIYLNGKYVDITLSPEELAEMEAARIAYESSPEYKQQLIVDLKAQLSATDYKAIKYAEGWISFDEYAPIRAERQAIREQINQLEQEANYG